MDRPLPPDMPDVFGNFIPDQDGLGAWARRCFIDPGTPLHNPDHAHLEHASIGWLWTDTIALNRGRRIAGEARMPKPPGSKWTAQLAECHLRALFGDVPHFVITIDAELAREATDAEFCALIEHELSHCGQDIDELGNPRFDRYGLPVYAMKGHDVEEFIGVARRYGAYTPGLVAMRDALNAVPELPASSIAHACGTCTLRLAA